MIFKFNGDALEQVKEANGELLDAATSVNSDALDCFDTFGMFADSCSQYHESAGEVFNSAMNLDPSFLSNINAEHLHILKSIGDVVGGFIGF